MIRKGDVVKAVREDKDIGVGSCTSIDECFTDGELIEEFERGNFKSIAAFIKDLKVGEGLRLEIEEERKAGIEFWTNYIPEEYRRVENDC